MKESLLFFVTPFGLSEQSIVPDFLGWRGEHRRILNLLFPQFTVNTNYRQHAEILVLWYFLLNLCGEQPNSDNMRHLELLWGLAFLYVKSPQRRRKICTISEKGMLNIERFRAVYQDKKVLKRLDCNDSYRENQSYGILAHYKTSLRSWNLIERNNDNNYKLTILGENLAKTLLSLWFGSANVDSRSAIANLIRNWINGYKEVDLGRWSANLTKPYCNQSFKNREKDSSQSRWNEIIQNYLNNNQKTIFFYLWELIGSEVENNEDGNIILIRELLERKAISTNNDDMKNILQEMRIFDISTDLLDKVFIHSAYTIKNGSKAKFKVQDIVMPRGTDWICDLLKTLKNSAPEYSDKLIGDIDPQNHETLIRSVIKRHMIKKGGASLLAIDEYGIITPRVMLKTNESIEKVIFRHPTYDKAELIKLLTLGEDFSMWENFLGSPSHRWRIDTLLRWFDFQTDPFKYKQ